MGERKPTNNIQRNLIGNVSEARERDVVVHLLCTGLCGEARARTQYAVEFDGVESEADRFNQCLANMVRYNVDRINHLTSNRFESCSAGRQGGYNCRVLGQVVVPWIQGPSWK